MYVSFWYRVYILTVLMKYIWINCNRKDIEDKLYLICQNCSMNSLQLLLGLLWKVLNHYNSRKTCLHNFTSFLYNEVDSNKDKLTRRRTMLEYFVRVATNGYVFWLCKLIMFSFIFHQTAEKENKITQNVHRVHTMIYDSFNRAPHYEHRKFSFGGKIPWSNKQIFNFVTSL